jgi:L-asparaginase/Glu-tRNA(Gln) amidotransferase subunit D
MAQSFRSWEAEQILTAAGHENAGTEFYFSVTERAEQAIIAAGGTVSSQEDEECTAVTYPLGTISYGDTVELPTGIKLCEGESLYRPA